MMKTHRELDLDSATHVLSDPKKNKNRPYKIHSVSRREAVRVERTAPQDAFRLERWI